ncbi:MAG: putative SnoaL-like aldol condensation-catalyzing enzyme [Crocinitomix sp.]|jgi:predicted SnoaL-like aldol condensation-catalyzing enzyme
MTKTEKAKMVITGISKRDIITVGKFVSTGCLHKKDFFGSSQITCTTKFLRTFEDNDYSIIHSLDQSLNEIENIDVFQFENGQIIGHSMSKISKNIFFLDSDDFEMECHAPNLEDTAINKALIRNFIKTVFIKGKRDQIERFVFNSRIKQLKIVRSDEQQEYLQTFLPDNKIYKKNYQIIGCKNLVLAISQGLKNDFPAEFYDLFKIRNRKIIGHWNSI